VTVVKNILKTIDVRFSKRAGVAFLLSTESCGIGDEYAPQKINWLESHDWQGY